MIQLILSIIALVAAAIFAVFFPGTGIETTIIALVAGIAGAFGVTNWREKYDAAKAWFQSKTKLSVILVALAIIVLLVAPLFVVLPENVVYILNLIIAGGGATGLWGIFSAIEAKTNSKL